MRTAGDWLFIAFVVAVLWAFWWWLGKVFDAIGEMHAARRREDPETAKGKVT